MTAGLPPYPDYAWGAFPPADLLPEAVRPAAEKLGNLRSKAMDARDAEITARLQITQAEADAINKAVDQLTAGGSGTVDSKPVDKAKATHEQAVRDVHATQQALVLVEREVADAYMASGDEAKQRVDSAIEQTKLAYSNALDVLIAARKAHLDAVALKDFTRHALKPLIEIGRRNGRMPGLTYNGGGRGISPQDTQRFRDEIDPPMLIVSRALGDDIDGPMQRADKPADAW